MATSYHTVVIARTIVFVLCCGVFADMASAAANHPTTPAPTPTGTTTISSPPRYTHSMDSFSIWQHVHGKSYASEMARQAHYTTWLSNLDYVESFASTHPNAHFKVGMNVFADLTLDEFKELYLQKTPATSAAFLRAVGGEEEVDDGTSPLTGADEKRDTTATVPTSIDWRTRGAVTAVKDQGQCGCCYVFSAVGAIESNWAIAKLRGGSGQASVETFSEQHLFDCCGNSYGNKGCTGGFPDQIFACESAIGGVMPAASYQSYQAASISCRTDPTKLRAPVKSFLHVSSGSEADLTAGIAKGPVVVPIRAYTQSFQFYLEGVYDDSACDGNPLDHVILAVGYNDVASPHYYIIKNSWSTHWGMNGYAYIVKDQGNFCHIASYSYMPTFSCIPQDCQSLGKQCGTWSDGCGKNFTCGPCDSGERCETNGTCTCIAPQTCDSLDVHCGNWSNGCSVTLNCGTCPVGGPHCNATRGTCDCHPTNCTALGMHCGARFDGCDSYLNCGTCHSPNSTCHPTGGYCYCKPAESCSEMSKFCGYWNPGCGHADLWCGNCTQLQNSKAFCSSDGYCLLPVSIPILFAASSVVLPSVTLSFLAVFLSIVRSFF